MTEKYPVITLLQKMKKRNSLRRRQCYPHRMVSWDELVLINIGGISVDDWDKSWFD